MESLKHPLVVAVLTFILGAAATGWANYLYDAAENKAQIGSLKGSIDRLTNSVDKVAGDSEVRWGEVRSSLNRYQAVMARVHPDVDLQIILLSEAMKSLSEEMEAAMEAYTVEGRTDGTARLAAFQVSGGGFTFEPEPGDYVRFERDDISRLQEVYAQYADERGGEEDGENPSLERAVEWAAGENFLPDDSS